MKKKKHRLEWLVNNIKNLKKMDYFLLIVILIMSIFGTIAILSATSATSMLTYHVPSSHFFIRQLLWIGLGLVAGLLLFLAPKGLNILYGIGGLILFGGLLMVVFASGKISGGAASWIRVQGGNLQPSEFIKPCMIVFMASYYDILAKFEARISKLNQFKINALYYIPLGIAVILFLLIFKQPDMGSAFILFSIACLSFICIPYVTKNFKKIAAPLLLLGFALAFILIGFKDTILSEEQLSRLNFLNPCARYYDTGSQVCNSLIAISNGGLFGVGPGNSTQKFLYLSQCHTDFIFPIIIEECGAITGFIIILAYGFILTRIYKIARKADNTYDKIIAYGTLWYLTLHIIINILGVMALMPVTGVPLPFLSYGGSFMLNAFVLIFLTEKVNANNKVRSLKKDILRMTKSR